MSEPERPRCRFCSQPLHQEIRYDPRRWNDTPPLGDREYRQWVRSYQRPTGTYGYQGNGYFCSLRCGYYWAVRRLQEGDEARSGTVP